MIILILVVIALLVFFFPKRTIKGGGSPQTTYWCECFGIEKEEKVEDMSIVGRWYGSTCYGIVYGCKSGAER